MSDKAVIQATLECFCLTTNTFVTLNDKLGFSLREMKEITCLPIVCELYEDYVPLDNELEAEIEEFRALFFLVMAYFESPRRAETNQNAIICIAKVALMSNTETSASFSRRMVV